MKTYSQIIFRVLFIIAKELGKLTMGLVPHLFTQRFAILK